VIASARVTLQQVHVAAVGVLVVTLALSVYKHRVVVAAVKDFFLEPSSAINLALLRVLLFTLIFRETTVGRCAFYGQLPKELMGPRWGWDWVKPALPLSAEVSTALEWLVLIASALAIAGLFTRVAVPVAAVTSIYVLGLPNFFMKIDHGYHAIVLCALVLGASPCGDALSLDRLWRRYRGDAAPTASVAYTLPMRFCWLILGTVYLFPGFCKLWDSGDLWLNGTKLKVFLYSAWAARPNLVPPARIDEWPFALQLLGFATLFFEIALIFALFHRTTRIVAALSAVLFHLGTGAFMGIRYHPVLPLMLLLDVPGLVVWLEARAPTLTAWARAKLPARKPAATLRRAVLPSILVGGVLFAGQMWTGVARIHSWPISIHPLFSGRRATPTTHASATTLVHETAAGDARDITNSLAMMGPLRFVRVLRNVGTDPARRKLIVRLLIDQGVPLAAGDHLVIHSDRWDLFPLGARANHQRRSTRYVVTNALELEPESGDVAAPPDDDTQ
jgi:hypothetical protein